MRFPYGIADFRKIREDEYSSGSHAPAWAQVQTLQRHGFADRTRTAGAA